jgi:hypothetical protein
VSLWSVVFFVTFQIATLRKFRVYEVAE